MNRLDALYHFVDLDADHTYDDGTETLLSSYDYTVNLAGLRTAVTEIDDSDNQVDITWTYDALNRLTEEAYDKDNDQQADTEDYVTHYIYDLVGNRTHAEHMIGDYDNASFEADEIVTYAYDDNDRLLTEFKVDDTESWISYTEYTYGPNADIDNGVGGDHTTQTLKTVYSNNSKATKISETTLVYGVTGRLIQVDIDSDGDSTINQTLTYTYNDDGIRVSQTVDDGSTITTTTYVIDTNNPTGYAQVLEEWDDTGSGAALDKTYVLGHDVIAQASASSVSTGGKTFDANEALYLLADGHGSTRQLYGQANTPEMLVAERYAYDAYGVMLVYGNLVGLSAAATSHLYSGEQTDALTGMQYLRARYYNPSIGRFNRVDPFAGNTQDPQSLHKYAYAYANPVMGVDPSGLVSLTELMLAVSSILLTFSSYANAPGPNDRIYSGSDADGVDVLLEFIPVAGPIVAIGARPVVGYIFKNGRRRLGVLWEHTRGLMSVSGKRVRPIFSNPANQTIGDYLHDLGRFVEPNLEEGLEYGVRRGDAFVDGIETEFKRLLESGADHNRVRNVIGKSAKGGGQARNIFIDARGSGLTLEEAERGLAQAFGLKRNADRFDVVEILGDDFFITPYEYID